MELQLPHGRSTHARSSRMFLESRIRRAINRSSGRARDYECLRPRNNVNIYDFQIRGPSLAAHGFIERSSTSHCLCATLSRLRISYANGENASSIRDANAHDTRDNGSEEIFFFRIVSMPVLSRARASRLSLEVHAAKSRLFRHRPSLILRARKEDFAKQIPAKYCVFSVFSVADVSRNVIT